ncbi:MFS transporter [Pokkaliibacter sp. CJK22405]|uniref:MFS transporter n=1 Tax=Pokkaliibacter sp. CJK22405 TaxID=3384615 RepID=UPI0039851F98
MSSTATRPVHSDAGQEHWSTPAIHGAILATFMAASSAPTPLYHMYQQAWGFSSSTLTLIFAIYAFALLFALLVGGKISDHIGRRPVIFASLIVEAIATLLFTLASDSSWLIAARLVQGLATGVGMASLGAALLDVNKDRGALINSITPLGGMALGALGCTLLVQFAPAPMHLIYDVLLAIMILGAILIWKTPETADVHAGALRSLKPSILVPQRARAMLLALSPLNIAIWGLGGFYLSLMPSLVAKVTGSESPLLGGLTVSLLTLSGASAIAYLRKHAAHHVLYRGAALLTVGLVTIITASNLGLAWLLLTGSVIAGLGFGSGFLGVLRSLMPLANPRERAGLMAAYYLESYLAFSVPAMGAGALAHHIGLIATATWYGSGQIALIVLAVVILRFTSRHHQTPEPA